MLTRLLLVLTAIAPLTAAAQGEPALADATNQGEANGPGPAVFKAGTLGLSFGVPGGGASPGYAISAVKFINDKTAYDVLVGFDLHKSEGDPMAMPPTASGTAVALTAGLGYRMYKRHAAKIHTYLEPSVIVSSADLSEIADNLAIGAGAAFGVECMFTEWFSIRGQVGAQLTFAQKFKDIQLSTGTSGLFANMYWN